MQRDQLDRWEHGASAAAVMVWCGLVEEPKSAGGTHTHRRCARVSSQASPDSATIHAERLPNQCQPNAGAARVHAHVHRRW